MEDLPPLLRRHPALAGLAGASSAVLAVPDPARAFTIAGLAITNGVGSLVIFPSSSVTVGGGIYNDHAMLMVSNCTISGNSALFAAGIYNAGTLNITNSTINGNIGGSGGIIANGN